MNIEAMFLQQWHKVQVQLLVEFLVLLVSWIIQLFVQLFDL